MVKIAPVAKNLIDSTPVEALEELCADDRRFEQLITSAVILGHDGETEQRRTIFRIGFGMILIGTSLQLIAAWP